MGRSSEVSAIISPSKSDSPELQLAQARMAESIPFTLSIACAIVEGKIKNQMHLLKYYQKSRKLKDPCFNNGLGKDLAKMDNALLQLDKVKNQNNYKEIEEFKNKLFGIEGQAAIAYWHSCGLLLPKQIEFPGLICQGAVDLVNSSLNYRYALLKARVEHAIIRAGLSVQISFLHSFQRKRSSLVFDMMEEFRSWAVDRPVLNFICQKNIDKSNNDDEGRLSQNIRRLLVKTILERWEKDYIPALIFDQITKLVNAIKNKGHYRSYRFKW